MARVVSTADEFDRWLKDERRIPVVMYFAGDMARFRKNGERTLRALARARRLSPAQDHTREKIKAILALCDRARWHARQGNVHLVQRRGANGWVYFARRGNDVNFTRRM
jgi:hypothetical protein